MTSLILVLLAVGCGEERQPAGGRTLDLSSGSVTEDELRADFRATFRRDPGATFERLCDEFLRRQPTTGEVLVMFAELKGDVGDALPDASETDDETRAAEIIKEECARMMNE
jgi:hypothetical protein